MKTSFKRFFTIIYEILQNTLHSPQYSRQQHFESTETTSTGFSRFNITEMGMNEKCSMNQWIQVFDS